MPASSQGAMRGRDARLLGEAELKCYHQGIESLFMYDLKVLGSDQGNIAYRDKYFTEHILVGAFKEETLMPQIQAILADDTPGKVVPAFWVPDGQMYIEYNGAQRPESDSEDAEEARLMAEMNEL